MKGSFSVTLKYRNQPWSSTSGGCFYESCSDYVRETIQEFKNNGTEVYMYACAYIYTHTDMGQSRIQNALDS